MIRRLTQNLGWKLASLVIAVLLWYALVGDPEFATSISAPIVYRNIPSDLEMSSDVLDRVHLEIRGPSGQLHAQDLVEASIVLDLSTVHRAGERTFTIQQTNVNLPPGVTLSRAVPAQVRIRFEKRTAREVPVEVRFSSQPSPGYRIVSNEVIPPRLRVIGPESRVNRAASVQTDPVDLRGVVGEAEFAVHAYTDDSQLRFESPPDVRVKVALEKAP